MNGSHTMHSADPDALYAYAFSMHQAGNARDAVPLYQQLHKQFPDNAEILTLLGIAWLQLENISEGIRLLKQSLNISPNQPVALFNLGDALCTLRHFDEALINYDQAIIFSPYRPEIYNNRAIALNELMRFEEALLSCDCAIALNPYSADAHYNKGNSLNGLKCFNEALAAYESAILLKPDFVFAYNNRVNILSGLNRFEEALISCDRAIELNLDFAEAYSNRGYILKKLNRFEEALISCNCAIKLKPDFADAYCNRSIILIELKKFEEALIDCDNAIVLNPKSAIAYFNKALTQLLLGNYEEGWKLYESRWEGNLKASARVFNQPLWLRDALLSGKTILIYEEQGVGDVIQMCRYLHLLNALGANIILEVRSQLIPLLLTLKGNIKVIEKGDDLPLFDFYCPIMSLPLALKTTVETIPKGVPYLFVDSDKQKIWQGRLGEKTKKRIGFVCSGSATHNDDSKRSILLKFMRPLLNLPFEFHLLQKEISAEDVSVLTEFPQVNIHHENLHDFADTAALVNEMDLVISVDTSVAHLAGALGKSVWILIPWVPDFRWLLDRTDSPWYPTATLFRQHELGNWESVIEDVCQKLKHLMNIQDSDLMITDPDALYAYAFSLHQAGQITEAIKLYEQLNLQLPDNPNILTALGVAWVQLDHKELGASILKNSLELLPGQPIALFNLANALGCLKRYAESLSCFDKLLSISSDCADVYSNRAVVLNELRRYEDAILSCDCAIALKPDLASSYYNKANALNKLKRFEEALENYNYTIAMEPSFLGAYCNRGAVYKETMRLDQALVDCDYAISLDPESHSLYWNKAFIKLMLGDYEEGWKLYEWRWKSFLKDFVRVLEKPLWLGDAPLSGKTILIYEEQGLGDVIQACRYVYALNMLGARVILEVPASLTSIMRTLKGDVTAIEKGYFLPTFDFQCPIMSLPLAFKTTVNTIPADVPYLFVDSGKQKEWQGRLGIKTKKRIGLVCSGSTIHDDDSKRSIPLKFMRSLLNLLFEFHILQKEIRPNDAASLAEFPDIQTHQKNLIDFSDTAALVNEMDLVISVDTSVAHLAGALGKSVWILIPWVPDFRWLLDRTDSPWYPTATLFRQQELGNWERVIDDVCQRLKDQFL